MPPFIHPSADVEDHVAIGPGTKIWRHVHVMTGAHLGARCVVGQGCFIAGSVRVGDDCRIQNNVSLYDGVILEDHVFVGPSAVFTNVSRPRAAFLVGRDGFEPTVVQRGATIGANATIVCGVTIGNNAFVGAGAVVTHDVPPHALVLGVPARVAGWVCACGHKLSATIERTAEGVTCVSCGRAYRAADRGGLTLDDSTQR